jgi:hypothetical protein
VGDVLDDDEGRPEVCDDARVLVPEPALRPREPFAASCDAEILAWESSADDINGREICRLSDILEPCCFRPVFRKHSPTKRVDFDLPHDLANTRALEAKLKPAHSRK